MKNNFGDLNNFGDFGSKVDFMNVKQEAVENSNEETQFVDVKGEPVEKSQTNGVNQFNNVGQVQNGEAVNAQINGESLIKVIKFGKTETVPAVFPCNICDQQFAFKYKLKLHKKIHSGEKPFSCDLCGMSFAHKNNLSVHNRKVHGVKEKNHKCDICGKTFARNGHLKLHYNIHTGEKPYKCDICQKSFHADAGLAKHNKSYWHLEMLKYITGETSVNPAESENAFTRKKKKGERKRDRREDDSESGAPKKKRRKRVPKVPKAENDETSDFDLSGFLHARSYDDYDPETNGPSDPNNDENIAVKYEEFEEDYENVNNDSEGMLNSFECNVEIKEEPAAEIVS